MKHSLTEIVSKHLNGYEHRPEQQRKALLFALCFGSENYICDSILSQQGKGLLLRLKWLSQTTLCCYQIPQAVILLKQGFGRLVRTKTDMGVVAILDSRIKTRGYGFQFLESLPECKRTSSIDDIREFLG